MQNALHVKKNRAMEQFDPARGEEEQEQLSTKLGSILFLVHVPERWQAR